MLPVRLDRTRPEPLPAQLAAAVRGLVTDGTLSTGDRLPSSRALAADLHVARAVVEQAYDQLLAEAWVETRRGSGTFVASGEVLPVAPAAPRPATRTQRYVRLDAGTPWIDPRHLPGWRRAWREVSVARAPRGYPDALGLPELREALAERLARTRGLSVEPDEILVTAGTTDGLRQLLGVLGTGDVLVEDPGYRAAVETVRAVGRGVVDHPAVAPVTDLTGCVAAYVTPAHQHPLGRVMPAADRLSLLGAARAADAVVLEDDYDSEFRYDVAPVPALAALDRSRVAYLGTAAKSVGPGLRLGWLVAPPELHDRLLRRRVVTHDTPPWPTQRALLTLLRDGWVDRVVRTARRVYASRAPRVAAALGPHAELAGPLAGMYSTWLTRPDAARAARDAARAAGFDLPVLADYCRTARLSGLVVGFGGVTDAELDHALSVLAGSLGRHLGGR
ncbi:PLP-dependent aminotransferase family protein [Promicromonospora thailandica]|uniref:Transcriptional regulator, GntR family n=1 Tax=Promicromonospora thailandica TaxID=765201 RepID=A0A9X2G4T0_9MICO|nr:PLP-dependent aminotransferase family protein [Promicromonospora thailandica]MCP2265317.1 transcriptional regulator, GntR family [Promicromonospora thailandica]BFF16846.1 PLP-dependent aminotransferase family protein [Promicromonospora thailandica]